MFTRSLRVFPLLLLLCCHFVSATIPSSGCTLRSSTPANTICGKTGSQPQYTTGNPRLAYQTLSSVADCQELCLRRASSGDASCVSFSYDSSSKLCTITPGALTSISEDPASTIIFYERACFACPKACSQQAIGQNLFDNSGFESSPKYLGPWFSSGGNKSTQQGIHKGGNGSKLSYFCTAGTKCSIQQSFSNCNVTVYKWSYDYKAAVKKFDSFYATASYGPGTSHSLQYPKNSPGTLKWHTYTDLVQLNFDVESAAMALDLHPGKPVKGKPSSTLLADNIKLVPTDYIVGPEPDAYNSLPGGSFENGTLAPWTSTQKSEKLTIVRKPIKGNYALQWDLKKGQVHPSFGIMQDLTKVVRQVTVPGQAYLFNVDYQNNLPQGHGVRPLISAKLELFTGANESNITNTHNVYTQFHDGNVGTIRIPFMGQVNQHFTRMTITITSDVPKGGNYFVIIDDISFKPLAKA